MCVADLSKAHCFFEQSGTFKNAFKHYGIDAECYDIQNNFGETDNVIDLFAEIEKGYDGKPYCPFGHPGRFGICRFKWLELEYEKPPRGMEDIIGELRELSSINPMPGALAIGDCISTIYGKPVRRYLDDLADEIEAVWNRRSK